MQSLRTPHSSKVQPSGVPQCKGPRFLCPWSGSLACLLDTAPIPCRAAGTAPSAACPPASPSSLSPSQLAPFLSSVRADAPHRPCLCPGCSLCQEHAPPKPTRLHPSLHSVWAPCGLPAHLTPTAPSLPLIYSHSVYSHLDFFLVYLLCLLIFKLLIVCGLLWNVLAV